VAHQKEGKMDKSGRIPVQPNIYLLFSLLSLAAGIISLSKHFYPDYMSYLLGVIVGAIDAYWWRSILRKNFDLYAKFYSSPKEEQRKMEKSFYGSFAPWEIISGIVVCIGTAYAIRTIGKWNLFLFGFPLLAGLICIAEEKKIIAKAKQLATGAAK
jgi:prepilin signal peptidase PulO-like enzyme (type II secretory pathway)